MKPSIASLALAALLAAPVWAPASIPSGDVLSALSPAPDPSADLPAVAFLSEIRGPATLSRTCDRLGLPLPLAFVPEEAPIRDFLLDRNPALATVDFDDAPDGANILSLDSASRDAFFALFADNGWSNDPDTAEGFRVFVSPSGTFREYVAELDSKLLVSTSPAHLAAACALYPSLPPRLPAEGDIVVQLPASAIDSFADGDTAEFQTFLADNFSSLTAGLGLDGDTAALQTVLAPVPGSPLSDLFRALGPIPPAAACVNLPGALAFFAEGTCPDLRDLFPNAFADEPLAAALERHTANQPASFAFFPPATPGRPRALAYLGLNDPAALRAALLDLLSRRADAISVATDASHRDIPVDTLSIADPAALQDLLTAQFGPNPQYALIPYIQQALNPTLALAWLPNALLVAFNDPDSALLHPALDSLLDGGLSARQFEQSPAFQSAFPHPDAPAHALAHLDLDALLAAYAVDLPLALPAPCPLDLFAYIAPDASLVLRLRAPADLVHTLATAIQETISANLQAKHARMSTGGSGAEPPSLAPSPDGGASTCQPDPSPWDTATPIQTTPETLTFRDLDPERLAFWRDFLDTPPPPALAPFHDDFARLLAFGADSPEAAADLHARAFPDRSLDDPVPLSLPLPWAHAAAVLRHAANRSDGAVADWLSVAAAGDDAPSPVPDADRSWRDLFASAMAADRYLTATTNWTDPDTLVRRETLRALGARRAALVVSRLNPSGLRGRFFLILLAPEKPNFTSAPKTGGLSPIGEVFEQLGCTNAVASVILSRDEKQWAWALRGGGWASTVTDEGWRGFGDHLDKAVAHALRARSLEPRWPEPWHALMAPAGAGHYAGESLEDLARGALERQIDYVWALDPLFNFSRPRWCNGGTPACLRALRAVVDIPRTDVATPFKALEKLDFLVDDQLSYGRASYARAGFPAPLDTDPRLWPAFRNMFERYLADPDSAVPSPEVLRAYIQTAARFRDPAPALAALDRLPSDEADALWTEPRNPDVPRAASLVGIGGIDAQRHATIIDSRAPGARARHAVAVAAGDKQAAQAALDEIDAALAPIDRGLLLDCAAPIVRRMARDQSIAFDWEPGDGWDSINRLRPITFYREGSAALRLPSGGWLFWNQDDSRGASIDFWRKKTTCAAADFTVLSLPGDADPAAAGFFVRLHAGPAHCVGVALNPFAGTAQAYLTDPADFHVRHPFADATFDPLSPPDGQSPTGLPSVFRLRVRCENGLLDAWLDGTPLFTSVPVLDDFPRKTDYHPAFGTTSPLPGPVYSIDRIRLAAP